MFNMNFSDAPEQSSPGFDVIPKGTKAKFVVKVQGAKEERRTQGDNSGCFNTNPNTGSVYLNLELTVMGGKYNGRKIFKMVGFKSSDEKIHANGGEDKWANQGKTFMRSLLESARNINPKDTSPQAIQGRALASGDPRELNGIEFAGVVTVDENNKDAHGNPAPRNDVIPLTMADKDYVAVMSGTYSDAPAAPQSAGASWGAAPAQATPSWGAPQGNAAPAQSKPWEAPPANGGGSPKPAWAQ